MTKPWLTDAIQAAGCAGGAHDPGKLQTSFRGKLVNAVTPNSIVCPKDSIRHEAASVRMMQLIKEGIDWPLPEIVDKTHALNSEGISPSSISKPSIKKAAASFDFAIIGIQSFWDAVMYAIFTHHRLMAKPKKDLSLVNHIYDGDHYLILSKESYAEIKQIAEDVAEIMRTRSGYRIGDKLYWQGIAWFIRAALILADIQVSQRLVFEKDDSKAYANTAINTEGKKQLNQHLDYHLTEVRLLAEKIAEAMATHQFTSLSDPIRAKLTKQSFGRFAWQNQANFLSGDRPALVFNIAATGSGKTHMNARIAAKLAEGKPLRLSVVLNLRSLTLQTGTVYKKELGVDKELAVVIGDPVTRALYEFEESDINEKCVSDHFENENRLISDCTDFDVPAWLEKNCRNDADRAIAGAPVLVSTIDYLVDAGDPCKRNNHPLALLRIMHSDLIIDEIDSYEPKPLAAVLRVITLAAMFGRNVIVSSATLTSLHAESVRKSYEVGMRIYQAMNQTDGQFQKIVVEDTVEEPSFIGNDFEAEYSQRLVDMINRQRSGGKVTKKGKIARLYAKTHEEAHNAILREVNAMHDSHSFSHEGKKISIGLVRIANIKNAIPVASFLQRKGIHVCCYHSRHFMIQRFHIEQRLDYLLTRKGETEAEQNYRIVNDEEIKTLIANSKSDDIKIVIVASPVEEIGRDHDFDYAVIEPSSAQSIVQAGGRVNRHRLKEVSEANIAILQYNFNVLNSGNDHKPKKYVFSMPGLEAKKTIRNENNKLVDVTTHHQDKNAVDPYDLCGLINENLMMAHFDADIRFNEDQHKLSRFDNESISQSLSELINPFMNPETQDWMSANFYSAAELREKDRLYVDFFYVNSQWKTIQRDSFSKKVVAIDDKIIDYNPHEIGLFTLDHKALQKIAKEAGIEDKDAFSVTVRSDTKIQYAMTVFGCKELPQ